MTANRSYLQSNKEEKDLALLLYSKIQNLHIINIIKAGSDEFGLLNGTATTTKSSEMKLYLFYFVLTLNEFSVPRDTLSGHSYV